MAHWHLISRFDREEEEAQNSKIRRGDGGEKETEEDENSASFKASFHPFEMITDTASSQATASKNGESLPIQSTRSFLFLFRKHSQFCMF